MYFIVFGQMLVDRICLYIKNAKILRLRQNFHSYIDGRHDQNINRKDVVGVEFYRDVDIIPVGLPFVKY